MLLLSKTLLLKIVFHVFRLDVVYSLILTTDRIYGFVYLCVLGDEFVDIHGKSVSGMTVAQVVEVIKGAPDVVIATVRPITVLKKFQQIDTSRTQYSTILPQTTPSDARNGAKTFVIHHDTPSPMPASADPDLDDVGNYDDEDDGDAPPPLPPRTEDALILVDPPPVRGI